MVGSWQLRLLSRTYFRGRAYIRCIHKNMLGFIFRIGLISGKQGIYHLSTQRWEKQWLLAATVVLFVFILRSILFLNSIQSQNSGDTFLKVLVAEMLRSALETVTKEIVLWVLLYYTNYTFGFVLGFFSYFPSISYLNRVSIKTSLPQLFLGRGHRCLWNIFF